VFWTYGFPLIMAVVLGFAFRPGHAAAVPVVVVEGEQAESIAASLPEDPRLRSDPAGGLGDRALARGPRALLCVCSTADRSCAPTRRGPKPRLRALSSSACCATRHDGRGQVIASEVEDRPGARYIDFLIPGLLGLNLLGAGMWGVGSTSCRCARSTCCAGCS
jgi:hypothetical protein